MKILLINKISVQFLLINKISVKFLLINILENLGLNEFQ